MSPLKELNQIIDKVLNSKSLNSAYKITLSYFNNRSFDEKETQISVFLMCLHDAIYEGKKTHKLFRESVSSYYRLAIKCYAIHLYRWGLEPKINIKRGDEVLFENCTIGKVLSFQENLHCSFEVKTNDKQTLSWDFNDFCDSLN